MTNDKDVVFQDLTLADLYHIPYGTKLTDAGSDIMTRKGPNITRYLPFPASLILQRLAESCTGGGQKSHQDHRG